MTHDQLQGKCHQWIYNEHPETRFLSHANFNNLTSETGNVLKRMAQLRTIGLVKGVLDYELFWMGKMYYFDFKVGSDRLSKEQKLFIEKVTNHGAQCFEIRSLEQFQKIIEKIIQHEWEF